MVWRQKPYWSLGHKIIAYHGSFALIKKLLWYGVDGDHFIPTEYKHTYSADCYTTKMYSSYSFL